MSAHINKEGLIALPLSQLIKGVACVVIYALVYGYLWIYDALEYAVDCFDHYGLYY